MNLYNDFSTSYLQIFDVLKRNGYQCQRVNKIDSQDCLGCLFA